MIKVSMIVFNGIWHDPRVRREATSAAQHNIDTTVIGIKGVDYKKEKVDELPFKTTLVEIDQKYYRKSRTIFTIIKREYLLYKKLVKVCIQTKPDVIHANDLNALPVAYFSAKKTKSRIVYDSHEIFTENEGYSRGTLRKFFWKTIERFLIKRVDQVVSVSHSAAAELSKMYGIPLPMVVTNCVFKVDQSLLQPKSKTQFEVLYHGKYYKGRGYEAFVKAAAFFKEEQKIRFVMRGFGNIESELREIAEQLQLGDKIRFDPPVDVTELVPAASSSHLGAVLTEPINKNFIYTVSNKLFEYLNAGLPVILSDVPEHRYLNDKYGFGIIIDEVTPENIADAIKKVYLDKELYKGLCKNAKQTADILNWDTESKKLIDVYNRLAKSKTD